MGLLARNLFSESIEDGKPLFFLDLTSLPLRFRAAFFFIQRFPLGCTPPSAAQRLWKTTNHMLAFVLSYTCNLRRRQLPEKRLLNTLGLSRSLPPIPNRRTSIPP